MEKIFVVIIISAVLIGSLFVVFSKSQTAQKSAQGQPLISTFTGSSASTPQASNIAQEQQADLIASNDVNSVDQIEADNLAEDVALNPNQ